MRGSTRPRIMILRSSFRSNNTKTPATYSGTYIGELFEAFGADASFDVIGANCLDRYNSPILIMSPNIDRFFCSSLTVTCPMIGHMRSKETRLDLFMPKKG